MKRLRRSASVAPTISILDAMDDPQVFGAHFRDANTWGSWRAFLAALFGISLADDSQRRLFAQCTGRDQATGAGYREAWLVCGRRSGKSFTLSMIAVFLAAFHDWRPHLGPGEHATVMVIAADRKQARVIMRYVVGLLQSVPMLAHIIESETRETVTLRNRVTIEIHSASFRSTRGYTIVAALCDEIAFWPTDDSAEPDYEVLNALRPGMATIPGALLLCASSPYARRGALWDAHRKHYGRTESPVLVWQAPTRMMNPTVPQEIINAAFDEDPAKAAAEWMAEFRKDREAYVSREVVDAATEIGRHELSPAQHTYVAFVDPSGGSSDSFTLAIAHREGDRGVLDAIRERTPPFSPDGVVAEFALLLKSYGIRKVIGDRYGGVWPAERFATHGITYQPSEKPKSDLFKEFLPLLNASRVELLDNQRLASQLCALERRTGPSGRDTVTHPDGGHDDVANAVAGACVLCAGQLSAGERLKRFADVCPPVMGIGALPQSAVLYAQERRYPGLGLAGRW
jgi:hypothetical protein